MPQTHAVFGELAHNGSEPFNCNFPFLSMALELLVTQTITNKNYYY